VREASLIAIALPIPEVPPMMRAVGERKVDRADLLAAWAMACVGIGVMVSVCCLGRRSQRQGKTQRKITTIIQTLHPWLSFCCYCSTLPPPHVAG